MDIRELKESEQLDVLSEFMYNKLMWYKFTTNFSNILLITYLF